MWIPDDKAKYGSQFVWVEVMRYFPHLQKVAREKINDQIFIPITDVEGYADKHNRLGIYTSIFQRNHPNFDSPKLANLYFDFDNKSELRKAQEDAIRLVDYLGDIIPESALHIFFSGKKGFSIECESYALSVEATNDNHRLFRYIAAKLKRELVLDSLDMVVYEPRRVWRLPNTIHQETGFYKIKLDIKELHQLDEDAIRHMALKPRAFNVEPQKFDISANQWYRELVAEYEQSDVNYKFNNFLKNGTKALAGSETDLIFDPVRLFEHCHAIMDWWNYAEKYHDLPHEVRLFLCSILTYTEDAICYLHAILSNCDDYNYNITEVHIRDWIRRREAGIGGRPFSCKTAKEYGVGCHSCQLEPKQRYSQVGSRLVPTGEFADPSPYRLAYSRKAF